MAKEILKGIIVIVYGSAIFIKDFICASIQVFGAIAAVLGPVIFLFGLFYRTDLLFIRYCEVFIEALRITFIKEPIIMGGIYIGVIYSYFHPKSFLKEGIRALIECVSEYSTET